MKVKIFFSALLIGITLEAVLHAGADESSSINLFKDAIKSEPLKKFSTYTRKIHPKTYLKTRLRTPVDV